MWMTTVSESPRKISPKRLNCLGICGYGYFPLQQETPMKPRVKETYIGEMSWSGRFEAKESEPWNLFKGLDCR